MDASWEFLWMKLTKRAESQPMKIFTKALKTSYESLYGNVWQNYFVRHSVIWGLVLPPLDDYENFISPPEVAPSPRVFHIPTPPPRPGFFTGFFTGFLTGLSVTSFHPTSSINVWFDMRMWQMLLIGDKHAFLPQVYFDIDLITFK